MTENNRCLGKLFEKPTSIPLSVLTAFDAPIDVTPLTGGRGETFLAGNLVIKPAGEEIVANWVAETVSSLEIEGLRVAKPVSTRYGTWVHEGWIAYEYVRGKEVLGRWEEKFEVADKLHQALANIAKPDFMGNRKHPWAIADRLIWESSQSENGNLLEDVSTRLDRLVRPIDMVNQVIHGDLTGNILFYEGLPPAVIDFSVYWRPADYAKAIIAVDSIVWEGAPVSLLNYLEDSHQMNQLLIRAVMWRIKTIEEIINQYGEGNAYEAEAYHPFIDALVQRKNI